MSDRVTIDELAGFFERGEMDDLATLGGIELLASDSETHLRTGISTTEADSQRETTNIGGSRRS
jgi:hypothetical protein